MDAADALQAATSRSSTQRIRTLEIMGCSALYVQFMALLWDACMAFTLKTVGFFPRLGTIAPKGPYVSTFANQIKSEISRLAKKEVLAEAQSLKKTSAAYRWGIAALKRCIAGLEAQIKKLGKGTGRAKVLENAEEDSGTSWRFRVAGFAALRKKLDIIAAEMGKLLGVSAQSVYHWETGKTKPRASQLAAISAVRKMGKREVAAKLGSEAEV